MSDLPTIHQLMSCVMADIGAIEKTQRNQQQNFNFRGIDDVLNALSKPLITHGVHYTAEIVDLQAERYTTAKGTPMRSVIVRVKYTFYGPQGDSVSTEGAGEAADSGDKAVPKALAIALKYALLHTFCIPTEEQAEEDPDRTSWTQPKAAVEAKPKSVAQVETQPRHDSSATIPDEANSLRRKLRELDPKRFKWDVLNSYPLDKLKSLHEELAGNGAGDTPRAPAPSGKFQSWNEETQEHEWGSK